MDKEVLLESRNHGDVLFPLNIYKVDYLDGEVIFNWHWHHEVEIILMDEGEALFQVGTADILLKKGEAIFIPSGLLHASYPIKPSATFRFQAIVFDINILNSHTYDAIQSKYIGPIKERSTVPILFNVHSDWGNNAIHSLNEIIQQFNKKSFTYEMAIKGHLLLLFSELIKSHPIKPENVNRESTDIHKLERLKLVLEYIDQNYSNKLNITDLADILAMSEGHFSRFFKSLVRMTPIEYINTLRINRAAKLLKETDQKIINISMEVGFDNPSYFIKTFKQYKKCTPSEFRNTN